MAVKRISHSIMVLCKVAICMLVFLFSLWIHKRQVVCIPSGKRVRTGSKGREGGPGTSACPAMHAMVSLLHYRTKSVTTCTTCASPVPLMPAGVMGLALPQCRAHCLATGKCGAAQWGHKSCAEGLSLMQRLSCARTRQGSTLPTMSSSDKGHQLRTWSREED